MVELRDTRATELVEHVGAGTSMGAVVSERDLVVRCRERKQNGEKIVLVAGIFDLLHPGHVRLLEQARDYGDVLVTAVLDDASVRAVVAAEQSEKQTEMQASELKSAAHGGAEAQLGRSAYRRGAEFLPRQAGAEKARARGVQRPVIPGAERAEVLAALAAVDYAVEIGIDSLPELLAQLRPDVAVESAEPSSPALLADAAKGTGVKLVRIPFEPGHSTAGIIERIVQLSGSE
jgi:cytidyltransferase-like protein